MRTLITAANRVLRSEVAARARQLAAEPDEAFAIDPAGTILWRGGPVGRMVAGKSMLTPRIEVRAGDFLDGETRERVRQRLQLFVRGEIERRLAPLFAAAALPLDGAGRGLAYLLANSLGIVATADIAAPVKSLDRESRRALTRLGVRFGTEFGVRRAAARPGGGAVSRALMGGAARPPGAAGAGSAQPRQGDPGRPGPAGIFLRRDRPPRGGRLGLAPGPAGAAGGGGTGARQARPFRRR